MTAIFKPGDKVVITSNRFAGIPAGSTAIIHRGNDQVEIDNVILGEARRPNGTRVALRGGKTTVKVTSIRHA